MSKQRAKQKLTGNHWNGVDGAKLEALRGIGFAILYLADAIKDGSESDND